MTTTTDASTTARIKSLDIAVVIGHTASGQNIMEFADSELFEIPPNTLILDSDHKSEPFILDTNPTAYDYDSRYTIPDLFEPKSKTIVPHLPVGTLIVTIAYAPTTNTDPASGLTIAKAVCFFISRQALHLTRVKEQTPHTYQTMRNDYGANFPIIINPDRNGKPDFAYAKEVMKQIVPDIDHKRYLFGGDGRFDYHLAGRIAQTEPNAAVFHFWYDPDKRFAKDLCSHVIKHTGPYFFHAQDNGASAEDMSIDDIPDEPGIWQITNGKSWSDNRPEFMDSGISGSWERLPLTDETARTLGYKNLAELEAELEDQKG